MRTKPDSHSIEKFIREHLEELTPSGSFVYQEDGIEPIDLGDSEDLLRALKDGIYGVLWGRYSSKTRVSDSQKRENLIRALRAKGTPEVEIQSILGLTFSNPK